MVRISDYLNIPYKYHGRDWAGADCYGLVILFFRREFGVELHDYENTTTHHSELSGSDLISSNTSNEFVRIDEADRRAHDVVQFCINSKTPNHVGILLNHGQFLQLNEIGCTVGSLSRYGNMIEGFYRYRGAACA